MLWLFLDNVWWDSTIIDYHLILFFVFLHGSLPIMVDNTLLLEINDEIGSLVNLTRNVDWASMCVNDLFADA